MATDTPFPTEPARTRRALLASLAAGLGAWAAGAVSAPARTLAGADGDVVLGSALNSSGTTTVITVGTPDFSAFLGSATGGGSAVGIRGDSSGTTGAGVWGFGSGKAPGVRGTSGSYGVWGTSTGDDGIGVRGGASGTLGTGVDGASNSGVGVSGTSTSGRGIWGSSQTGTGIEAHSDSGTALRAESTGGRGVWGESKSHRGVQGTSESSFGVYGVSSTSSGVHGQGTSFMGVRGLSVTGSGVVGTSGAGLNGVSPQPLTGVFGAATENASCRGVHGRAEAGRGVFGEATTGVGLYGSAGSGLALATSGRVRLSKVSGIATIGAGRKTVTVTPGVDVSSGSFVLLTPRANVGSRAVWFTVDPAANTFTIRMSGTRTSGTPVAWLLLS